VPRAPASGDRTYPNISGRSLAVAVPTPTVGRRHEVIEVKFLDVVQS
jgi:hypothetical protein